MNKSGVPWWKQAVLYHIYPRSFYDSNGDGVGDLEGIIAKLDYLVDLGVDGYWLSPIYPSPMADFGYDVADYKNVDPIFGDLDSFDRLLQASHEYGLRVLLDLIPNHTSEQHPWFVESRSGRNNPKRDWYIWRDPNEDGGPPNNWLSLFGGSGWSWEEATKQYYLHTFLSEQPDLNWRNPEVVTAMLDILHFWLGKGVDGFRVDAVTYLVKDDDWKDNPTLNVRPPGKDRGASFQQENRYNANQPGTHQVLKAFRHAFDGYADHRVMAGEVYVFEPETGAEYFGNGDECHLVFNFLPLNQPWERQAIQSAYEGFIRHVPATGEVALLLGGHDESRLASRYGSAAARSAAVMLMTWKGVPFLYYGDEIGMLDVPVPTEQLQDPWGIRSGLPHLSRDPARTPLPWSDEAGGGFSALDKRGLLPHPWLPMTPELERVNVRAQRDDPGSIWNLYRDLVALRRIRPSLHAGDYTDLPNTNDNTYLFERRHADEVTRVAINFSPTAVAFDAPLLAGGRVLISTVRSRADAVLPAVIELAGNEALMVEPAAS